MELLIVGLGSMGKRRARLARGLDKDIRIAGVDTAEARRDEAVNLGLADAAYPSIPEAVEAFAPDAALVCTAPLSHASVIGELLDLDAYTGGGYAENLAKAKDRGLVLFLSSTMLYRREIQYIKAQTAAFGKPVHYIYHIGQYLRWLFLGAVTGLLVGLVAAAFSHCLTLATAFRTSHRFLFLLLPAGGLLIVFLYKALHYENNHGTDSIIESIHTKVAIPLKMAFLIFVSTVITIFFGGSVGRESAALQMGASLGTSVGNLFHLSEKDKKTILMSGMAAAFSALFGTPMTASFFAMEVSSVGIMYYAALVPCICAALIARQTAKPEREMMLVVAVQTFKFVTSSILKYFPVIQ